MLKQNAEVLGMDGVNRSPVSRRSGQAALDVLEALPFMISYVTWPSPLLGHPTAPQYSDLMAFASTEVETSLESVFLLVDS